MRARLVALLVLPGALALPVSLSLHWYEVRADGDVSMTGWQAFEFVDVLLVIVAVVALAELVRPRWPAVLPVAAAIAVAAIGIQLIEPPPLLSAYELGGGVEVKRELGAWLGLGGAVLLLVAGLARRRSREKGPAHAGPSSHRPSD